MSDATVNPLPKEIDNERTIFSYGSLLDHDVLRRLLNSRGEFEIFETREIPKAESLLAANSSAIVILRDVRLENIRVSIVTETILRRWFHDHGGDLQKLVDAGVTTSKIPECLFLYARPAAVGERGRYVNGGLICNMTVNEVTRLDQYEFEPVLVRTRTPQLTINGNRYIPKNINFYAGTKSVASLTAAERSERSNFLNRKPKPGLRSIHAKWPVTVRNTK